jgi:hypothetical protein
MSVTTRRASFDLGPMRPARVLWWSRALAWSSATLGLGGCSGDRAVGEPGSGSTSTGTPSGSTSTTEPAEATSVTTSTDTMSNVFLVNPDLASDSECDIFTQNCGSGEKCMPRADDGGNAWNVWRCSALASDPMEIGEPCHAEGWAASGIDDCGVGAMCWDVDPKTNEGICAPLCEGSWADLYCSDPDRFCALGEYVLVCLPVCNPLKDDCPAGHDCYLAAGSYLGDWQCFPDASGDMGAYGDPCLGPNECDSGLVCLTAAALPPGDACEGVPGCCTDVCDITNPAGDLQCSGVAGGQICSQLYAEGTEPPGLEHVGICYLPA